MDEMQPINTAFPCKAFLSTAYSTAKPQSHNSHSLITSIVPGIISQLSAHGTSFQYLSFSGHKRSITVTQPYSRDSTVTAL